MTNGCSDDVSEVNTSVAIDWLLVQVQDGTSSLHPPKQLKNHLGTFTLVKLHVDSASKSTCEHACENHVPLSSIGNHSVVYMEQIFPMQIFPFVDRKKSQMTFWHGLCLKPCQIAWMRIAWKIRSIQSKWHFFFPMESFVVWTCT